MNYYDLSETAEWVLPQAQSLAFYSRAVVLLVVPLSTVKGMLLLHRAYGDSSVRVQVYSCLFQNQGSDAPRQAHAQSGLYSLFMSSHIVCT